MRQICCRERLQMQQNRATNHDVFVDAENVLGRLLEKLLRKKYHRMDQLIIQTRMVNPFVIRQKTAKKWFVAWQLRSHLSNFLGVQTYICGHHIRCRHVFAAFELCTLVCT